jgi:DNA-binding response OmpR family regulator
LRENRLIAMSTVLVVDDDVGVRRLTGLVLSLDGNDVCTASDGLEALEVLSHEPVDLVILDLEMPRMDGRQTIQEARREGYQGPVLILSAFGADRAAEELLAEDAVEKPFDPDELMSHVHMLLESHGSRRSE